MRVEDDDMMSMIEESAPSGAAFHFVCKRVRGMDVLGNGRILKRKKGKYD